MRWMTLSEVWAQCKSKTKPESYSYGRAEFAQVYGLIDSVSWGTGMMMGPGVFLYLPIVIKYISGPSTFISYIVGGLLTYLSAFAFAELSSRYPHCGGTYVYNYAIFGEAVAGIVGFGYLLQHLIIAADICISLSEHIDYFVFNRSLLRFEAREFSYNFGFSEIFASYPHFFASVLIIAIALMLTTNSKWNNNIGSIANYISFTMVFLIIVVGATKIDFANWTEVRGGFFPYGTNSIFKGATVILSTYLGYADISCLADESINPKRDIGPAIHFSFLTTLIIYISVSSVISLMVPYNEVNAAFAMSNIFISVDMTWMAVVVEIGAIFALFSTAMCVLQAASRLAFSMSRDGMLFQSFGTLNRASKTPFNSVMWVGFAGALLPLFFDSTYLIRLAEAGYLLNCVLANTGVIVLRYSACDVESYPPPESGGKQVTAETEGKAKCYIFLSLLWINLAVTFYCYSESIVQIKYFKWVAMTFFLFLLFIQCFCLTRLPTNNDPKSLHVTPFVPWLPMLAMLLTTLLLMEETPGFVWMVQGVCLLVSILFYFSYSFWNTKYHLHHHPHKQATASKPCEHEKEILRLIPSPTPPRQRLNQDSEGGREVREGGEGTEGSPVVSRSPVVSQTPRPHSA